MIDHVAACVVGLLCLVAGGAVGFQQILMGPDAPNYPNGPPRLRVLMFLWAVALTCRGVEVIGLAFSSHPPVITPFQLVSSVMVAAVHGTLLEAHLHQWLPARTWTRIRRLLDIATCGGADAIRAEQERNLATLAPGIERPRLAHPKAVGAALAELDAAGATVSPPGESLADFVKAEAAKAADPSIH